MLFRISIILIGALLIDGDRPVVMSDPAVLVGRLGAVKFSEREAAAKGLEALGAVALPALRAAKDARDPEVRARVGPVIERIEGAIASQRHGEILGWFPTDIESIVVARGPFRATPYVQPSGFFPPRLDACLQATAIGDLYDLVGLEESYEKHLNRPMPFDKVLKRPLSLAIAARRNFRLDLNNVHGESCHVLLFENDLGSLGDAFMAAIESSGPRPEMISGVSVTAFATSITRLMVGEPNGSVIYFARPAPNMILITTTRALMAEVLNRRATPSKTRSRALPESLPEWSRLDPDAHCWAVRHYARQNVMTDPTSPLSPMGKLDPPLQPDSEAVGLALSLKDGGAKLHYLSSNSEAVRAVSTYWAASREAQPIIRRSAPGVVEVALSRNGVETEVSLANFILLDWLFGNGTPPSMMYFTM